MAYLDYSGLSYFWGKCKAAFAALSHSHSAGDITSGTLPTSRGGTGNANGTVGKLTTARAIDGTSFDGSAAITHYGTCSTAAGTAAKTVALTGFTLVTGAWIAVRFTVTNTAAVANLTLSVNSTAAKPIKYRNGNLPSAGAIAANRTYLFVYDGTCWQLVGDLDTDTAYTAGDGLGLSGGKFSLADSGATAGSYGPSDNASPAHGGTFSVPYVTVDAKGRVTAASTKTITIPASGNTDTKNTAGSTDTSSKIFLVGATSQAANPQTYSHDTAYVGTDGCLYSGGEKVLTAHQDISGKADASAAVASITRNGTTFTATRADGTTFTFTQQDNNTNTIPSAYCETAAATAAKTASCTGFALTSNTWLHVLIKTANTKAAALTLAVNSTTAKPIYINGVASSSSNYTLPAGAYLVFYDGNAYQFRTDGKLPGSIAGDAATVGGHTVSADVPSGAKFTDTTYSTATTSAAGLMSSSDKTKLNGVATGATANAASTTTPKMDGTAGVGSDSGFARGDHVHPTDTTRAAASDLTSHTGNTTVHITAEERTAWNAKTSNAGTVTSVGTGIGLTGGAITGSGTIKAKIKSETAHTARSATPTNTANRQYAVGVDKDGYLSVNVPWENTAQNQNAFASVKVGSSTIEADSATDTLTLVAGSNVSLTADTSSDSVTIAASLSGITWADL